MNGRQPRTCAVAGCGRIAIRGTYCSRCNEARHAADPTWPRCSTDRCDRPVTRRPAGVCAACDQRARRARRRAPREEGPRVASYWMVHQIIRRERGPARTHPCADCHGRASEWSYDGTDPAELTDPTCGLRYSLDPARYAPRCFRCHHGLDVAIRQGDCARTRARVWLVEYLTERGGRAVTTDAYAAAAAAGISRVELQEVSGTLGLTRTKLPPSGVGAARFLWTIPPHHLAHVDGVPR